MTPRKPENKTAMEIRFDLMLTKEMRDWLEKKAAEDDRTASYIVRSLIRKSMEEEK